MKIFLNSISDVSTIIISSKKIELVKSFSRKFAFAIPPLAKKCIRNLSLQDIQTETGNGRENHWLAFAPPEPASALFHGMAPLSRVPKNQCPPTYIISSPLKLG